MSHESPWYWLITKYFQESIEEDEYWAYETIYAFVNAEQPWSFNANQYIIETHTDLRMELTSRIMDHIQSFKRGVEDD